jgi:hypothetical protein
LRGIIGTLMAAAVLAGLAAQTANLASGRTEAPLKCPDVLVIDSRGSGEPAGSLSPPAQTFVESLRQLRPNANIQAFDNPYPAVSITGGWRQILNLAGAKFPLPKLGAYNDSVKDGRASLDRLVPREVNACPKTKIVLTGYSQGAQVAADYSQQNAKLVDGLLLFGDPKFNAHDTGDRGGFKKQLHGALGERAPYDTLLALSYCHQHDPVCQFSTGDLKKYGTAKHKNYNKLGEPQAAARYFADQLLPERSGPQSRNITYSGVFTSPNGYRYRVSVGLRLPFSVPKLLGPPGQSVLLASPTMFSLTITNMTPGRNAPLFTMGGYIGVRAFYLAPASLEPARQRLQYARDLIDGKYVTVQDVFSSKALGYGFDSVTIRVGRTVSMKPEPLVESAPGVWTEAAKGWEVPETDFAAWRKALRGVPVLLQVWGITALDTYSGACILNLMAWRGDGHEVAADAVPKTCDP